MAITFAVRGDSFGAMYSTAGSSGITPAGGYTIVTHTSAISASMFQAAANNNAKFIIWPGRGNLPAGRPFSILVRKWPGFTGIPAASRPIIPMISGGAGRVRISVDHLLSGSGAVSINIFNEAATACLNAFNFGSHMPGSSVAHDYLLTCTGDTTAGGVNFYINSIFHGSATMAASLAATGNDTFRSEISVGNGFVSVYDNAGAIEEIVIWDHIVDPTEVGLVSGSSALNGPLRTSLVSVAAFDGDAWSTLAASSIKLGDSQTQAGVVVNGTFAGAGGGGGEGGEPPRNSMSGFG